MRRARPWVLCLFALATSGCASRSAYRGREVLRVTPPIVLVGSASKPFCTGVVIARTTEKAFVLTVAHCAEASPSVFVTRAEAPSAKDWVEVGARVACSPPASRKRTDEPTPSLRVHRAEWVVLDMDATQIPGAAMPVAASLPPDGAPVKLLSFFDDDSNELVAHAHAFRWGDLDRDLVQGGHSGGPVVEGDRVAALFSGARARGGARRSDVVSLAFADVSDVASECAAVVR